MQFLWEPCKSALNKQVKKLKIAIALKSDKLWTNVLMKMRFLHEDTFITSYGINYEFHLQDSVIQLKGIETQKKLHCHLIVKKNFNPLSAAKCVTDGLYKTVKNQIFTFQLKRRIR